MSLKINDNAPELNVKDQNNKTITLDDLNNQWKVLYFYPKDDTPGCTIEAKEFNDKINDYKKNDAVILGISPDNSESHCKFINKYTLTFTLLSDENHKASENYGVWKEKTSFGTQKMGIARTTFLIDNHNKIRYIWNNVKPAGHATEVLNKIIELNKN